MIAPQVIIIRANGKGARKEGVLGVRRKRWVENPRNLRRGGQFLMSEVPLYSHADTLGSFAQGYLDHKNPPPPGTTVGPYAQAYCRVLEEAVSEVPLYSDV